MKQRAGKDGIAALVIGGSAGAVEALSVILPALPESLRVPVFVVVHLPRDRDSLLAGIFAHRCARPVVEAEDKAPIEPGTIYFAPPDYHLLIDQDRYHRRGSFLSLSTDELVHFSRPSIDVLFESAADAYEERLAAVLLTGANHDGAAGIDAVRRAGGMTIVQDPATAQCPAMPAAALRLGPADFVYPIERIAALLRKIALGDVIEIVGQGKS